MGGQLMDAYRTVVALAAMPSQQAGDVVAAEVAGWQILGLPRCIQMDHELSCRGANRHPWSFGRLIWLCLDLGGGGVHPSMGAVA
jgi:putative transposase